MQTLLKLLEILTPYGTYSYFGMFGILLACGFGLPLPEDIVLITGGILSARGICDFWITTAVCMFGVLVGDGLIFYGGRYFGPSIKNTWLFRRIMTPNMDKRVMGIFAKYGDKVIFMARFMPGLRTPLFLTSGVYGVPPWKFFALDGFAAIISVPVWIYVGYLFGDNLEMLEQKIKQFQFGLYGVLALLLIGFIALLIFKKRIMKKTLNV